MRATMRMSRTCTQENSSSRRNARRWGSMAYRPAEDGVAHARHLDHLADVVHADHVGPGQDAGGHRGGGAHEPLARPGRSAPSGSAAGPGR